MKISPPIVLPFSLKGDWPREKPIPFRINTRAQKKKTEWKRKRGREERTRMKGKRKVLLAVSLDFHASKEDDDVLHFCSPVLNESHPREDCA